MKLKPGGAHHSGRAHDEYVTKVASNVKEAIPLIEAGFVEASDFGVKIFKIPKSRVEPVN